MYHSPANSTGNRLQRLESYSQSDCEALDQLIEPGDCAFGDKAEGPDALTALPAKHLMQHRPMRANKCKHLVICSLGECAESAAQAAAQYCRLCQEARAIKHRHLGSAFLPGAVFCCSPIPIIQDLCHGLRSRLGISRQHALNDQGRISQNVLIWSGAPERMSVLIV